MLSEKGLKKYQELKEAYQASFKHKRDSLHALWQTAESNSWTHSSADNLRHHLHHLAGSAASYGFEEISLQAAELEELLLTDLNSIPRETYTSSKNQLRSALEKLIVELEAEADRVAPTKKTGDR